MTQRQVLENGIDLSKLFTGPAKILYASGTLPMPVRAEQVLSPTTGAPASGWTTLGITRSGINVTKTVNNQVLDDADQITGAYGQRTTGRNYRVSSQMGEILDSTQLAIALETGTATTISTGAATQTMIPLDNGSNTPTPRRIAVVGPKAGDGELIMFVFRNGQAAGGDRVIRFDRSDPASPALDFLAFPEIATTIDSGDAWGRLYTIP